METCSGPHRLTFTLKSPVALDAGVTELAALAWIPTEPRTPASVVACFHGGGYTSAYFDLDVPGHRGYSMAEHLAGRGHVVVAFDQPGVGASSAPADGETVTVDLVVTAHHEASTKAVELVRQGELVAGMVSAPSVTTTGIGHSMGGSLLVVQQVRQATFDRVAILGTFALEREWGGEFSFEVRSGYAYFSRGALRHGFYWEDVPEVVIVADEALTVAMPAGVLPAPLLAAELAASLTTPLFIGFGERDVSPTPHGEVGLYKGSSDVTLHVLAGSGHCSNFSSGRKLLWDRLSDWINSV